jgi:hypothetical protein
MFWNRITGPKPGARKPTFSFILGAWRTIAGYEAIHMIRKGQACWSSAGAKVDLMHRFILGLFAATSLISDCLPRPSAQPQSCSTSVGLHWLNFFSARYT